MLLYLGGLLYILGTGTLGLVLATLYRAARGAPPRAALQTGAAAGFLVALCSAVLFSSFVLGG